MRLTRKDVSWSWNRPVDVPESENAFEKMGRCRVPLPARRDREEVNTKGMRKNFALAMVALLALTLALAAVGCGKKAEETTTTPPSTMTDTTSMQDTTAKAPAESSAVK